MYVLYFPLQYALIYYSVAPEYVSCANGFIYRDTTINPELQSQRARRFHATGRELPPNALVHFDKKFHVSKLGIVQLDGDAPITALNMHKETTATQMNSRAPPRQQGGLPPVAMMAPRPRVQQGRSRSASVNGSNLRPQQGGPPPTVQRLNGSLQPPNPNQSRANNAPSNANGFVTNPDNIVFEAPIQYVAQRRGRKETPGKVTLNQPPKKGLFRLFVMDKLYTEHGLGDFQNYTHNREEAMITVRFTDPNANSHTAKDKGGKESEESQKEHTLKFQTSDAAFEFLETYNSIWAGINMPTIPVKKPAQATNQRSNAIGAANSANTTGRTVQNGSASSVARNGPAPTQIGHSLRVARNGPAPPTTRNGPPPQATHWGARLAAATDFDPFSVTIGSPRSQQAQPPAPTAMSSRSPQAELRPPPGLPLPRVLAPPPGLSVPASGSREPPSQPHSTLLATPASGSSQQPNLGQPPKTASKRGPCNPPAPTMGQPNTTDIGKANQIEPESGRSNDIQPETRNSTAGNAVSVSGAEGILNALTKIAGITEAGTKESVDMASVQAIAKLLVSLIPGTLDNVVSGSMETFHKKETGGPSRKGDSVESSSGPRQYGERSGDSWMLVEAAETSESDISAKRLGTPTVPKPSAAKNDADSSNLRRLQYSENELRNFRHNAIRPPYWFNELRFLPARGENAHRAPAPAPRPMPSLEEQIERIKASAYEVNLGNQAASSGYVAKQAEHIKAVLQATTETVADTLGEAVAKASVNGPDKAAPETGAKEDPGKVGVGNAKIVSNPALDTESNQQNIPQPRSAGLQASVWAAGEAKVDHPHAFTGIVAEYPQHSYFNDLLLLVDDPVTNMASSNLGGEAMLETQGVQEQPKPPRVLGLGASRHAGPFASAPGGDKPPHYALNQRLRRSDTKS